MGFKKRTCTQAAIAVFCIPFIDYAHSSANAYMLETNKFVFIMCLFAEWFLTTFKYTAHHIATYLSPLTPPSPEVNHADKSDPRRSA